MSGRGRGRGRPNKRRGQRRGYGPTGFEEQGGYMAAKVSKLVNQYDQSVGSEEGEERVGIFRGVSIFVNGYTEPTAEELKRIMMTHGGTYHHYYSRSKTTHIIASNLPNTKIINMNTDRIVSPEWISDSLKAGTLLDYTNYILYTNQSTSQPKLSFKKIPSREEKEHISRSESAEVPQSDCSETSKESSLQQSGKLLLPESSKGHSEPYHSEDDLFSDSPPDIDKKESKSDLSTEVKGKDSTTPTVQPKVQHISPSKGHSMSTANPKFLSEFYNNSRLHHISTMGAMFKQYVTEMQSKKDGFPGREALKEWVEKRKAESDLRSGNLSFNAGNNHAKIEAKSKRTIMHVDMDCFFVSVGLRNHPELRGKPVAVTHSKGNAKTQAREGVDRQYELNFYKDRAEKRLKEKMKTSSVVKAQDSLTEEAMLGEEKSKVTEQSDIAPKFSTVPLIDDTCSMSEIASCSYEARKAGVKNGMFMGPALKLCPDLKTIPYDFEGYKEVAYKLYDIVASFTHDIEAVSCDEMFVDLTELLNSCQVTPLEFASYLRQEVQGATGCPCSAGMGPNMLIARMATRRAKPNGQYKADPERLAEYMVHEKVTDLPGVGWSLGKRLDSEGIKTCGNLQVKSLSQLQSLFGAKTGQSLYFYCRGIDDRPVKSEHVRKSVSAEVNYGIRFTCQADAVRFVGELAAEVENRLNAVKLKGKCITLKLKTRAKDAPVETAKFMGHGVCDNVAKSVSLTSATSSASIIEREVMSLLRQVKVPPQDFRGVGIQVSRLEGHQGSSSSAGAGGSASIKSFLLSSKSRSKRNSVDAELDKFISMDSSMHKSFSDKLKKTESSFSANNTSTVIGNSLSPQPGPSSRPQPSTSTRQPPTSNSKMVSSAETGNCLPATKGSVDMEVLLALPEDMRAQVIAEYEQQGYTIPESCKKPIDRDKADLDFPKPSTSYLASTSKQHVRSVTSVESKSIQDNSNSMVLQHDEKHQDKTSLDPEDSDDDAFLTSFSQVDSSFLAALPEDMREELRQDFEQKKQIAADAAAAASLHQQKQAMPMNRNDVFQNRIRTNQNGTNNPKRTILDGSGIKVLPGKQVKTGKKRGRKPKSLSHPTKKSPSKSNKISTVVSPKTVPSVGFVKDEQSLLESKTSSQDSSVDVDNISSSVSRNKNEETPQLCGAIELAEVKALIRQWVSSCPNPEEEDVDIIATYFISLITFRDLERLDLLIKHLYRQVIRTHNCLWQSAYNSVIEKVQTVMESRYEAKLKVASIVVN